MTRPYTDDDAWEDEDYRRRIEQERAERAAEMGGPPAPAIVIHAPLNSSPTPVQRFAVEREMACLACGAGMLRGTQCRRCGAWCR